jgi:hypothetical protein
VDSPRPSRWRLHGLLAAVAAAGAVLALWLIHLPAARPDLADPFPIPPYSATRFLNTGPDAHYIGSAACAGCHRENYESYLLTPHSRALSDVDPATEPPDAAFEHAPSGRSYRVYRQDGRLRHQEVMRTEAGEEVGRVDLPVRYLVGSGHYSRTYLVEVDGFLHESPITWYASRKAWGLSPGYDHAAHAGFERPVGVDCLSCHAGRAEAVGDSFHRVTFHEQAIGCENCHGPGSLHEAARRAGTPPPGGDDPTIVHPGRLSRPPLESVCAACHMDTPARVDLRGRHTGDFRPGRPLTDYRIDYRFQGGSARMTVVGHVEQLRQSACYQKSDDLTCVTCHDPHRREAPKDPAAYYRQKCLDCHDSHPCGMSEAARRAREPADSCVACHMPRGDTEIPHIAFTHHRIGLHPAAGPAEAPTGTPELVPADDDSGLPPLERRRNLGVAYLKAAWKPKFAPYAAAFLRRGRDELEAVHAAGLPDAETALGLAQAYMAEDHERARRHAREALAAPGASADVRGLALTVLANCDMQDRHFELAADSLEQVARTRRFADDWQLLGAAYLNLDRPAEALPALQKAAEIRPFHPAIQGSLADVYARLGDARQAAEHRRKARWLADHQPKRP